MSYLWLLQNGHSGRLCVSMILGRIILVHCIVSCRQVDECCTGDHNSLVTIFDELSQVKQLAGA